MSPPKNRVTLDSLSNRFARKEGAPAAAPEPTKPVEDEDAARSATRDNRVQILTRIDAATRKKLKMIAVEQDRTVQDICEQAIRDFVTRHTR